jgi:hypothetical protein
MTFTVMKNLSEQTRHDDASYLFKTPVAFVAGVFLCLPLFPQG